MLTSFEIEQIAKALARELKQTSCTESLLDSRQAAELLGCSVATVERLTRSGELPSLKLGRLRRYEPAKLIATSKKTEARDA